MNVNSNDPDDTIGICISDRESFGRFCVALAEDDVSFSLGGGQTIFVTRRRFKQLPSHSQRLYRQLEKQNLLNVYDVPETVVWPTRTLQEAKQALRELL